jgi:hypothetical protein
MKFSVVNLVVVVPDVPAAIAPTVVVVQVVAK